MGWQGRQPHGRRRRRQSMGALTRAAVLQWQAAAKRSHGRRMRSLTEWLISRLTVLPLPLPLPNLPLPPLCPSLDRLPTSRKLQQLASSAVRMATAMAQGTESTRKRWGTTRGMRQEPGQGMGWMPEAAGQEQGHTVTRHARRTPPHLQGCISLSTMHAVASTEISTSTTPNTAASSGRTFARGESREEHRSCRCRCLYQSV